MNQPYITYSTLYRKTLITVVHLNRIIIKSKKEKDDINIFFYDFRKFFNMGSNQKILSKPIIRPIHIPKPSEILSNTDP